MSGKALVCRLNNITPIEGADFIRQAELFGERVIVGNNLEEGSVGLLFDCDTQLHPEFCYEHNLFRHSYLNKDTTARGYFEDDCRVRPIKLKGVKCTAFFLPFDIDESLVGTSINGYKNVPICCKYINPNTIKKAGSNQQKSVKKRLVPDFVEHMDTDQFQKNIDHVLKSDRVIVTEKLHGTSGRCGYLQVIKKDRWNLWQRLVTSIMWFLIDGRRYDPFGEFEPEKEYQFVVGSRRVIKRVGDEQITKPGFYENDVWSVSADDHFKGKLRKGETVYYEIVGYQQDGSSIMSSQPSSKLKNFLDNDEYRAFVTFYGETVNFDYLCAPSSSDVYVYRITTTDGDGNHIDLSWEQLKRRCEEMHVKHVPELGVFNMNTYGIADETKNKVIDIINTLRDVRSEVFPNSVKEGICIRCENGKDNPKIFKDKTYVFKVLENIIKDSNVIDTEESN